MLFYTFLLLILIDTKNKQFPLFHLINFVLLPACTCQKLLLIVEAFVFGVNILSPLPLVLFLLNFLLQRER